MRNSNQQYNKTKCSPFVDRSKASSATCWTASFFSRYHYKGMPKKDELLEKVGLQ